jgi:hypothetical protein
LGKYFPEKYALIRKTSLKRDGWRSKTIKRRIPKLLVQIRKISPVLGKHTQPYKMIEHAKGLIKHSRENPLDDSDISLDIHTLALFSPCKRRRPA